VRGEPFQFANHKGTACMRRILSIVVFSLGILCIPPDVLALRLDRPAYRYPYTDPYLATTTLSITRGRTALSSDDTVSRRSLEITVLEGRDSVYLLTDWGNCDFASTNRAAQHL
jgi:hypothetical protein